jgi:hypothetical protein
MVITCNRLERKFLLKLALGWKGDAVQSGIAFL